MKVDDESIETKRERLRDHIRKLGGVLKFTRASVETTCRIIGCEEGIVDHFCIVFADGTVRISSACALHVDEVENALAEVSRELPTNAFDVWLQEKNAEPAEPSPLSNRMEIPST